MAASMTSVEIATVVQQLPDLAEADRLALVHGAAVRSERVGVARGDQLRSEPEALRDDQAEQRGESEHAHPADVHPEEDDRLAEWATSRSRCRRWSGR